MKPRLSQKHNAAMTLFEVGVVVAVVMILFVVFAPVVFRPKPHRYSGISCANNIKQVRLAYLIWAGDNGDIFPTGISVTNGGSMELVATGNVVSTFLAM